MEKKKYIKPALIALDEVAPVFGASCVNGPDLATILYCPSGGSIATGNCESNGGTAGSVCVQTGLSPKHTVNSLRYNPGLR